MKRLALILLLIIVLILLVLFWRRCGSGRGGGESTACSTPCSASGQCTLVMPLPYFAEQAVLAATDSLVVGSGSTVTGINGAPGALANLGSIGTTIADHAKVGGIVSRASVTLGAGATVTGPVTTGGMLANPVGATVTGRVADHATIKTDRHVMATVSFPASAPPVNVGGSATQNLVPGSYGDVRVAAGGTLALTAGTYHMTSLMVPAGAALNLDERGGPILIYVKEAFELAGDQNQIGGDGRVLVAAFGCAPSVVKAPFRGTLSVQNGPLVLSAPAGSTFAGHYFASSIALGPNNTVTELPTTWPSTPPRPGTPPARLPPKLPPPPAPVVGCYVNTKNGWRSTPCATDAFIRSNFVPPDAQLTATSAATPTIVFGQVAVTLPQVGSVTDGTVANRFSLQETTNLWTVPAGNPNAGDTAAVQFVIQSNGSTSGICIWQVDVTAQSYPNNCVTAQQRSGNIQAFDAGNVAGYVNSNGTITMVAQLSWVPNGNPNQYAVVATDNLGLAANWSAVSGSMLGMGGGSQAVFTNTEMFTQAVGSTCAGDIDGTSAVCPPPTLQPNATAYVGGTGTIETNNLTAITTPSVDYPNADLVVSNLLATTSGSCLGTSHAYMRDNPIDYGSTPSNLGGQVFWESPDIFLVPRNTPVDLNAVSTETILTPGGLYDIWVRVHNDAGCSAVNNVKTLVYLADPSALSVQWTPITGLAYVGPNGGSTGVTAPAGGEALIGPLPFTAPSSGLGNGHKCILAAIQADGEVAPANTFDAPNSNQVAQRNIQFVGPCVYPLTNGTTSAGNVQLTLSMTPTTGTAPSLTALPDVEVGFDDFDSSWYNVWNAQSGAGTTFAVTHSGNITTVRLGAFSVALNSVPLAAGQTRSATGVVNLPNNYGAVSLQIAATLTETGSSGQVMVSNGGSCVFSAPVIK
jgi:hypothetical protein